MTTEEKILLYLICEHTQHTKASLSSSTKTNIFACHCLRYFTDFISVPNLVTVFNFQFFYIFIFFVFSFHNHHSSSPSSRSPRKMHEKNRFQEGISCCCCLGRRSRFVERIMRKSIYLKVREEY